MTKLLTLNEIIPPDNYGSKSQHEMNKDLRAEAIKRAKHFKELSETYREDGDSYSASECHGRMLEAMDFANLKEKDLK